MTAIRTIVEDAVVAELRRLRMPSVGGPADLAFLGPDRAGKPGYLRTVGFYGGQIDSAQDLQEAEAFASGCMPAILVYTDDGQFTPVTLNRRRVRDDMTLVLVIMVANDRDYESRVRGEAPASAYANRNPGINQTLDDVLRLLLSRDFSVEGLKGLVPRHEERVFQTERVSVWRMRWDASVTLDVPAPDLYAAQEITEIEGRTSLAGVEDALLTGSGDSFTYASSIVTLTDAAASFTPALVGLTVRIEGAASPGHDGSFLIVAVPSSTQLMWVNPNGVAEAFAGTWTVRGAPLLVQRTTV